MGNDLLQESEARGPGGQAKRVRPAHALCRQQLCKHPYLTVDVEGFVACNVCTTQGPTVNCTRHVDF